MHFLGSRLRPKSHSQLAILAVAIICVASKPMYANAADSSSASLQENGDVTRLWLSGGIAEALFAKMVVPIKSDAAGNHTKMGESVKCSENADETACEIDFADNGKTGRVNSKHFPPGAMKRLFRCNGDDSIAEVYAPEFALVPGVTLIGMFALDLSDAMKGKDLEPVKVSLSKDGTTVTVNQYTRGLKPTKIPKTGGVVSFDHRFASNMTCLPAPTN